MKKTILSLATLALVVTGITNSTYAATANRAVVTTLTDISSINKIEVRGNVQLYISDGNADQVKVYNKYYSESAVVQSKNGTLLIASYTPEKLVVWVTAADLRSVSAYDNSEIKSFGDLSKIEFSVDLHNTATAKLSLDAYSATISLSDRSKADLSGNATEFSLNHNYGSSVNKFNFTAAHTTENKFNFPENKDSDMAGM